jgi:GGDEF domain-containing protein
MKPIRGEDFSARCGGEEFAVMPPGIFCRCGGMLFAGWRYLSLTDCNYMIFKL